MYAKNEYFYNRNRVRLADVIPLDTPFGINVEFTSACNLKCKFCGHSSESFIRDFHHEPLTMTDEVFCELLKQLREFPHKLKTFRIAGYGENLLHPKAADYISQIHKAGVAESVELFTNATLLNDNLSEKLVSSGLNRIIIAVEGLSDEEYERNTGVHINFNAFTEQIKYLFEHKGKLQIDLKIADACLPELNKRDGQEKFYQIFGNLCDRISVEGTHILIQGTKSYGSLSDKANATNKFKDLANIKNSICPLPFYSISVRASGNIGLCYCAGIQLTASDLNIMNQRLIDVWNGALRKEVLLKNLKQDYTGSAEICGKCPRKNILSFPEDSLDDDCNQLIERIGLL